LLIIPRMIGVSNFSTVWFLLRSPKLLKTLRCVRLCPISLLTNVIFSFFAISLAPIALSRLLDGRLFAEPPDQLRVA